MKFLLTAAAVIFILLPSNAQVTLSKSIRFSAHTYVYKINKNEAALLIKSNLKKVDDRYLHSLVDSFRTNIDEPKLSPGNYLFIHAEENKLIFTLHTPGDVQVKVFNNNHEVSVMLHQRQGTVINNAKVYYRNKQLNFNQRLQTYGPVKRSRFARLKVEHEDIIYTFPLEVNKPRKSMSRFTRLLRPKYIVARIKNKFRSKYRSGNFFYSKTAYEGKFKSFMVFNKPEYKPGDTVFLKAFVQNHRGKKLNRKLLVRLSDEYYDIDTILTSIKPYRAGGYEYQFVLSDSLDLDLDEDYFVTLEEEKSRKYNVNTYTGLLDDEAYAAKRKVVARAAFNHEEYELSSIRFSARSSSSSHNRGEETAIYFKATDENNLPVMDGRVEVVITADAFGHKVFHASNVFLPDTLWVHSVPLDHTGETKLILPDSIFPRATFSYRVACRFLNSNNELQTETLAQYYTDDRQRISIEPANDSLKIDFLVSGKPVPAEAVITVSNENDTLEIKKIRLPAMVKMHPLATEYFVATDSSYHNYRPKENQTRIAANAARTADSITVDLVNPYHYPVWYTIFAGKKIVHRGFGESFLFQDKVRTAKNYFVSLQYIYNNEVKQEIFTIPFQNKLLAVRVTQPEFIYPGQKAALNIQVSDSKGKPVEAADVTAYAYTSKFKAFSPSIPYMGKAYPLQKRKFNIEFKEREEQEHAVWLNWNRWSRELHLDTNAYYQFTHPGTVYIKREPAKDSITQLAPFVVIKGELQPVYLLYIDETPVFFSQAEQMQRYSFRLSPARYLIRLRTKNMLITLDSIHVAEGMKTLVSIEADTSNKRIRIEKMPDTLTRYEQQLWSKYMILVENNFSEKITYIEDGSNFLLLNENITDAKNLLKVGPIKSFGATFISKNVFQQHFVPEGNWQFNISKGLIRQKQFNRPFPFRPLLNSSTPVYAFGDFVLTRKEIDSLWQNYLDNRSRNVELFQYPNASPVRSGRLRISVAKNPQGDPLFIRNIILFRNDNPDFIKIYSGVSTDLGMLDPGNYRLFFLLKEDRYFILDSIDVLKNGVNFYKISPDIIRGRDSSSSKISATIESRELRHGRWPGNDGNVITKTFNDRFLDPAAFKEMAIGVVTDEAGMPIPFVNLIIKGTQMGTTTDDKGQFAIRTPARATLTFSAAGFQLVEVGIYGQRELTIIMKPSENKLEEVVVVGYGIQSKKNLTGSISGVSGNLLSGKVAGIMVRGAATTNAPPPLIIVNGIPYSGNPEDFDKSIISSTSVLNADAAMALYGIRAAGGAIIITTIKNADLSAFPELAGQEGANSLRRNFRDHAYWQPKLKTDANGNVSFPVQFPDDITSWKTIVIAMGDKRQSGYVENNIRSFKALSGNITLPQFAVAGDSIDVIGKTLNYLSDTILVNRSFSLDDKMLKENVLTLKNAWIDTFAIVAANRDSLKLKYTITKTDGYFDGEERSIPVYQPGVLETNGFFAALNGDTTLHLSLNQDAGVIKLYAEASVLPALFEEAERIRNYEYLCNEQLASKLKALLVQKKIDFYMKRPFTGEKQVRELINKLNNSKSGTGLWGWWPGNNESYWISLHVLEALTDADLAGYKTNLSKQALIDYLVYKMPKLPASEKISGLFLLHKLDGKADYKTFIDSIEKHNRNHSLYEHLRLAEFKQLAGLPVVIDSFVTKQQSTVFGNLYWGTDNYQFFNNSIQNTLSMYRILKRQGGKEVMIQKIRNFFLEKRKSGHWRNTYESSLILETILPDLLGKDTTLRPASLTIFNKDTTTVNQFPFYREVKDARNISIVKAGTMPVYFTAYQQYWNKTPDKSSNNFTVKSFFEEKKDTITRLTSGSPVSLKVIVTVKAEADYVMIEIPIPAGCSYRDKLQPRMNNEVHREYLKNKVSIFCSTLQAGHYEFSISLLPRYSGRYTLNPAKAEMMYFPVFYGREAVKKLTIK